MNYKSYFIIAICAIAGLLFWMTRPNSPLGGASYGRLNQAEKVVLATSTNANFSGLSVSNVNDFQNVGFTLVGQTASGTLRFGCSTQDSLPDIGAATTTDNRWDYVDFIDTATDSSIDGYTGISLSNTTVIRQFVVRNSIFKWCTPVLSGNTTPAGYGTTTVYLKAVDNQ